VEIGLSIPHTGAAATRERVREWCVAADRAGFNSLWANDHIVLPRHVESKFTVGPEPLAIGEDMMSAMLSPNFELISTLGFVAGITERIKIGSAVMLLVLRNAVLNARQLATIDRYSGGRLLVGIGAGWVKEEADSMNMPWDRRGARAEEHIALLRAIWTADGRHVEFHGEFWDIPPMDPEPRPVQRPIPVLIGGHSEAALDRAARIGDGWITAPVSSNRLSELLLLLNAALERHDREPATLPIYCRCEPGMPSLSDLRRYEELGVHSLHIDIDSIELLKRCGDELVPVLN
jgi:probable F420-dependent oxidoreductase